MCPLFSLSPFCCDKIPDKRNLGKEGANFDQSLRVQFTVAGKPWHRSMRQLDVLRPKPGSREGCMLVLSWLSLFYSVLEPSWWDSADHLQNRPPFLSQTFLEIAPRHTGSMLSWRLWVLLAWRRRLTITAVCIAPVPFMMKWSGKDKGRNKETMSTYLEFQLCTARCGVLLFLCCFFFSFLFFFQRKNISLWWLAYSSEV